MAEEIPIKNTRSATFKGKLLLNSRIYAKSYINIIEGKLQGKDFPGWR